MEEHNNNSNRPSGGGDNNKNPKNRQSILMFLIIAMVAILFWNYIGSMGNSSNTITYDEFVQMLDDGKVEKVNQLQQPENHSQGKGCAGKAADLYHRNCTGLSAPGAPGKSGNRIFRTHRGHERGYPVRSDQHCTADFVTLGRFRPDYAQNGRRRRHDGHERRQEQSQGLY